MTITAAVDGSALGNPGPAGWAWYIDDERWGSGGWPEATNNRGELQALIELLRATAGTSEQLHVLCDSKYVINSVTKWMPVWKLKGWKKANGGDVLNRDQMEELDAALRDRDIRLEWVKGHSSHRLNDAADARARAAAEAYRRGTPVDPGPGFSGPGAPARDAEVPARDPEPERAPVTVSCRLDAELADRIVERAQAAARRPQDELAELIALGMERKYGMEDQHGMERKHA
ncbi:MULTISPECIES: ribonuclease H [unclassified Brevibacterium]|uniref:ribonuclease H family protein n=1 Tax=unclassified Brevibacterium TaxID=2614124 RepID=UPI0010C79FFA|nr:ribonuclease H [Brevibacterium sp. CS2]MCK1802470.1 ribonuclease HI [Brevibacterium sp. R8603A2]QCP05814.1 ribonuclease HI [Brevibacterium sp. CS2]